MIIKRDGVSGLEKLEGMENLPEYLRELSDTGMQQITPFRDGMEGFFIARLKKANG